MPSLSDSSRSNNARFATTRWSIVLEAGHESSPNARTALSELCETYWYPMYAFARRRGYASHDAMDVTQAFFTRILEKDYLRTADREKGRFRSFLLTMFKRFLSKEREGEATLKRGGDRTIWSLDVDAAEARYQLEPADERTPDRVFERRWALDLLDRVLARLREDYEAGGKSDVFDACSIYLVGSSGAPGYSNTARQLDMSEGAVKVAVHRLRQRYRDLLLQEVSETVESNDAVDDELKILLEAVRAL